jgi:hypothetical protein
MLLLLSLLLLLLAFVLAAAVSVLVTGHGAIMRQSANQPNRIKSSRVESTHLRIGSFSDLRFCGFAVLQICGFADWQLACIALMR